jgi:hypothetical protein
MTHVIHTLSNLALCVKNSRNYYSSSWGHITVTSYLIQTQMFYIMTHQWLEMYRLEGCEGLAPAPELSRQHVWDEMRLRSGFESRQFKPHERSVWGHEAQKQHLQVATCTRYSLAYSCSFLLWVGRNRIWPQITSLRSQQVWPCNCLSYFC